jgi:hypothetical protein
MNKVF